MDGEKDTKVAKTTSNNKEETNSPIKKRTFTPRKFGAKRGVRKGADRGAREKKEFNQKLLEVRRVTRVVAGGRRFSFAVSMLIGDGKGKAGIGTGKSTDTTLAISKAVSSAKKNMITIKTTDSKSIPHEVKAKYKSAEVFLMPNGSKGVVAGGAVRDILNIAGVKNVTGKLLTRTKNKLNTSKAVIEALKKLKKTK